MNSKHSLGKFQIDELKLRIMEGKQNDGEATDFRNHIKDWGLSNTTLEEVFMRVISA